MAKSKDSSGTLKVLLLVDCVAGKCASVVEIPDDLAAALVAAGEADDNLAAVAAGED